MVARLLYMSSMYYGLSSELFKHNIRKKETSARILFSSSADFASSAAASFSASSRIHASFSSISFLVSASAISISSARATCSFTHCSQQSGNVALIDLNSSSSAWSAASIFPPFFLFFYRETWHVHDYIACISTYTALEEH